MDSTVLTKRTVLVDCCISTARWGLSHGSKRKQHAALVNLDRASHRLMLEMANGTNRQADLSLTEAGKLLDILCS